MPDLRIRIELGDHETSAPRTLLDDDAALQMLTSAEITAATLVPWGSNYTFAVALKDDSGANHLGIYKPQVGERPLWDFPTGTLHQREYAAYRLSRWLEWNFVPPTVIRDGPHGVGSLQLYVEPKDDVGDQASFWGRQILPLERIVMFDHIANNADRKAGHCLVDVRDRIWGIDHGLTFNVDPKLKTVLWQFSGEPVDRSIQTDIGRLLCDDAEVISELADILHPTENDALRHRVRHLLNIGRYPILDPHYNLPYGWW